MYLKGLLAAILAFISISVLAQQRGNWSGQAPSFQIIGKLIDKESGTPIEFATVSVFSIKDSTLTTGALTNEKGRFVIDSKPGAFYLKIQFMGFQEQIITGIRLGRERKTFDVGNIFLETDEKLLDEVLVEVERTQMELTLDKKVYNIGKDLSNLGGSASDLLANLPSVEVDVDGNVALRGSENVQILIDGKPSGLIGLSGSGGLQQLQGNLIEKVEIITNPSARYDAEGGAGIINIILKKDKAKGFNGSFQVQGGLPANNGASVNVNYRTGWINWFVNYGVTFRESPGQGLTNNFFENTPRDTIYFIDQINERNRKSFAQNIRFGSDIYFNEKNVLTLSASYRDSDNDNTTETSYNFFNRNRQLFADRFRIDNEDETDINWQYEVLFERDFQRNGQKLSFNLQYQDSGEIEISEFDDVTNNTDGTIEDLIQRSDNDNGETRTLVQLDYVHPFAQEAKFEVGFRYNFRNIFNDYIVESDSLGDGNYEEVVELTNDFNFDESILATYFILSNKLEKFSWQIGGRLEHTTLETLLEQTNQENNQNYWSFFPSANLTYKYSKISSLQLSYSRRVSRPRFRSLNPFTSYSNPLSLYVGNPNLQPQFTDSYELGILQNRDNSSIYLGIYHRHTEDVVQRIQTEENGVTTRFPENLGIRNDVGIELNISQEFGKKIRSTGNINFYNQNIDGGEQLSAEATTLSTRIAHYYRNSKLFNAQLTWFYRAPQNTPQGRRLSISSIDVGLSRDVLKKNGTVALNVSDVLNTRKYRGETITETFRTNSEFQWRRGPTAVLSFTYRLNQKKQRGRRSKRNYESGSFEEGF